MPTEMMILRPSAARQTVHLSSRAGLLPRTSLPARQQLPPPSSTFARLQPSIRRQLSTSSALASPPIPSTPSSPAPSRLSLSDRSHLVRSSTRRQLLALQLELEQLRQRLPNRSNSLRLSLLLALVTLLVTYQFSGDFRRVLLAGKRCALIGVAVAGCIVDYKMLFRKTWAEDEAGHAQRHEDYEDCHRRCAERIREVLKKNGGIYIKVRPAWPARRKEGLTNLRTQLGQHLSSIQLIPVAWSSTMKPLQDQCFPTPLADLQELFLSDVGAPLSTFFSTFDPVPIGVASLAQVHRATDRESGRAVAVKIMHPDLEE